VCGIVDEPTLPDELMGGIDRKQVNGVQLGMMVTLGAYAYCKVDADIAPVAPGDLLTTSATPGYAQKLNRDGELRAGSVIGKALGALARGKGLIPVFVTHQ
jgi:hypothetical protein